MSHALFRTALWLLFVMISSSCALGQWMDEGGNDDPRGNIHVGTTFASPLNPMARLSDFGLGVSSGAGYNFTRRHAVIGEFMWTHLYLNSSSLNQIRAIAQDPNINAASNLFGFTGNYRYELRGQRLGTYLIFGGGLYYRTAYLTRNITVAEGQNCGAVWRFWGGAVGCTGGGTFTTSQTIGSTSSFAGGVNGGIGFTARVGEAPYRVYVETRYHYAPTKGIDTQLIGVSVGIRY
jgi:hypothetical protein